MAIRVRTLWHGSHALCGRLHCHLQGIQGTTVASLLCVPEVPGLGHGPLRKRPGRKVGPDNQQLRIDHHQHQHTLDPVITFHINLGCLNGLSWSITSPGLNLVEPSHCTSATTPKRALGSGGIAKLVRRARNARTPSDDNNCPSLQNMKTPLVKADSPNLYHIFKTPSTKHSSSPISPAATPRAPELQTRRKPRMA